MLSLAGNQRVGRMARRNTLAKRLAQRFIAGETIDEAIAAVRELNASGLKTTLDLLGENVSNEDEAATASGAYCALLDRIAESKIDSTISIKLTMLGLNLSEEICRQNIVPILERARTHGTFVRIDMEGSPYTQQTLDLFYEMLAEYGDHVGVALQSYLYRTDQDVTDAVERRARVRIVKGAYAEPDRIAYPEKRDVDTAFRRHIEMLLGSGQYHAVATHDEKMINAAKEYASKYQLGPESFEFQMLYGIRRDLQQSLRDEGYVMRVYVPYGTEWYPYYMRRLAERPANMLFVARQIFRR